MFLQTLAKVSTNTLWIYWSTKSKYLTMDANCAFTSAVFSSSPIFEVKLPPCLLDAVFSLCLKTSFVKSLPVAGSVNLIAVPFFLFCCWLVCWSGSVACGCCTGAMCCGLMYCCWGCGVGPICEVWKTNWFEFGTCWLWACGATPYWLNWPIKKIELQLSLISTFRELSCFHISDMDRSIIAGPPAHLGNSHLYIDFLWLP